MLTPTSEGNVTASFADNEIWHVMIADDMKRMNIDQLDDAFRLSVVDASTMVWTAGMKTWRRLGSIADLEDAQTTAHSAPPPPPRPLPAPARPAPFAVAPAFSSAPAKPAFAAPAFAAPGFPSAPVRTMPLAPVYTPQISAPNAYAFPRRAVLDSDIDFRRRSGGVRWGRWFTAGLLVSVALLAAYRQNLLRVGARSLGVEQKYLHGEMRVTALVSKQAPAPIQAALRRLGLLPGPNAAELARSEHPTTENVAARAPTTLAAVTATAEPRTKVDPDIKTVSLDSLPVLGGNSVPAPKEAAPAAPAPSPSPAPAPVSHPSEPKPVVTKPAAPKPAAPEPKAAPVAKAEPAHKAPPPKAEPPVAKAEPPAHKAPALPPPSANDSPLKAAIRMAIAADSKK
jgi:hypothetical protein